MVCVVLAAVDRLDAGAQDFGEVGGVVEREGDDRGRIVRQPHADHRHEGQGVVDEQQLQHQRRAAHQPDEAADRVAQRREARQPRQRQRQPQRQRQRQRDEKQPQRDARAVQQRGQDAQQVVHHRCGCGFGGSGG